MSSFTLETLSHVRILLKNVTLSPSLLASLRVELRHYIPRQLLLSFYHTLITPYLTYGISALGYCAKTHLNRLLILQKRALRLIFFCRSREHAIPLFIKSNCLPISFLFFQQLCYLMYDIHTQVAPINLINQFTKIRTMHNYNTRSSSNECFTVKTSRTENYKNWRFNLEFDSTITKIIKQISISK